MNNVTRILIVEDQTHDYEFAKREIIKSVESCVFERVENRIDYLQALDQFQPEVILCDYNLPTFDGLKALKLAQQHLPSAPVIIWTGSMSEDVAVECMKQGASNYVIKDRIKRLGPAVVQALKERKSNIERRQAEEKYRSIFENSEEGIFQSLPEGRYISVNPAMARIYGYSSPGEMINSITDIARQVYLEPEERSVLTRLLETQGTVQGYESKNIRKDGSIFWTSTTARLVRDDSGNILYYEGFLQDITDRRLADEKLEASEKRFRALIENGMDSISLLAEDGTLLWENPSVNRPLGYAADEFINKNIFQLMHPEDVAWVSELFTRLVSKKNTTQHAIFRLKHHDDTWRWIEASATNMLHEPSIGAVVVNYRDITERRNAEEDLRESQSKYRNLVETSHDLIWAVDADANFTFLNRAAKDIYGFEPEELVGRSFLEIMDPGQFHTNPELFKKNISLIKEQKGVETYVRHRDGRQLVLSANSIVIRDDNGNVLGVTGSSRDITESKYAEDKLRESEERYRLLFENNPLPMWIFDYETLKFLTVNEAAIEHYGYSRDEFLSMTIKDIRPSADIPRLMENLANAAAPRQRLGRDGVWRHIKKDGAIITVEIISHPVEFEGRKGELILAVDITKRHEAEVEIQQRNDDLALVNALNEVNNRGQGLDAVVEIMRKEVKRLFGGEGVAIYLLDADGKSLTMQQYMLRPELAAKLEKLIGLPIPAIKVPIQKGGYFEEVLLSKQGRVTSDPLMIQKWMAEFTETAFLPRVMRASVRKLIPSIFKLLNIKSTMLIPLVWEEKTIGLLDISGPIVFSAEDLERIENIAGQLTTAIRRNQMEDILKEERNLLRTLIDNLPDRIYVMDTEGRKSLSNTADWKASGGKTMEDIVGKTDFETYPPELAKEFWKMDKAVLDSGQPLINFEEPGLDPEGNLVSILTTKIPLRNEEGKVIGLVGVGRDITERKQAEAQINELLTFNEKMLRNSPVGIITYKATGECIFANENAASIVGTTVEALKSQNFHTIASWKKSGLYNMVQQAIESRTMMNGDFHHLSTFGKDIWMTVHCVTFLSNEEEHVLLSISDITAREQVEQALRESEKRLNLALAGSHMGVWEWNLEDNSIFWSPECYEISGVQKDAFDGTIKSFTSLVHPDDMAKVLASAERSVAERSIFTSEFRIIPPDGELRWLSTHGLAEYEPTGKPRRLIGIVQDITMRRRAEYERQAVLDIMQGLANTKDLNEFLKLLHTAIGNVIYAENFFIILHQRDRGLFEEIYSVDQYDPPTSPSKLEKSITSYVFRSAEPLLLTRERIQQLVDQGEIELVGTLSASWLGAPLKTANGTIGVIAVQDYENPNRYSEQDKDFLSSIASQIALAVERKQAEKDLKYAREFLQGIQNSLSAHIVTLDQQGVIVQVNKAWRDFAEQNGSLHPTHYIGCNYLDICEMTIGPDAEVAQQVASAIRDILAGRQKEISVEYACHSPFEQRWFTALITCFDDGEQKWAILAHENITQRKLAEVSLMERTIQFRTLFEASPEAIILIDPRDDWLIVDCNSAACKMNGYQREELIGKSIDIINTHPDSAEQRASYLERIKAHDVLRYETQHVHKDGTLLEIEVSTTLIQLGGRDMVLGIDRDITERKRAEQELRTSEERFRQLATNIEELFWMTDAQTEQELYVSPAVETIWGMTPEYFINTPHAFMDSIMVEDRATVSELLKKQRGGEKTEMEYRIMDAGGSIRWIWDRAFPIFDEAGNVIRVAGIAADITQRKQAEDALRESETRFSSAFGSAPIGIALVSLEGQCVKVNQALCELLGYTENELVRKTFQEITYPDDLDVDLNHIDQLLNGEKNFYQMEKRYFHKSGNIVWALLSVSLVKNGEGNPQYFISQIQDITQRKQSEMEIQRYLTELQALYENGLSIGRLLEPKEIGEHIIQTFARHMSWHHVAIRLLSPQTNKLELIAFNQPGLSDEARSAIEQRFNKMVSELGQGLSGWVMQSGKPLRTGNVHTHPQYVDTHEGIMSGLYMPLNVGGQTIGCISVESEALDAFSAQDERLLATLANQAAIAFENARLYQAAQLEISERRRAQEALWLSESHYRELADSITDILFELDHDLRYTHWNKASEMFSGIPAEDAIGRSIREVFGDSEPQIQREETYRSVLEERQARIFETEIVVKGQKRYLEINAYPSARGVSVVAKDVTARKLVEILLHKRLELIDYSAHHSFTELMRKTIDEVSELTDSHVGFLHFVEEDEKTVIWQTWSSETINLMGNVEGMEMHFPVDEAGMWADAVRQRRAVIHNDYESIPDKKGLPEGHIQLTRELVIPIIRNEMIVAVMGIGNKPQEYTQYDIDSAERFADYAWDVIERKRMESALADERNQLAQRVEERTADLSRANSNLARALRVKDEFLANMSHELRTPLNAILGLSESLGEQVAGPLNEKQQKYLSTINESGHHLLSLINDILDLAKIEAGQITLDINKVDVNSVCQASLRMVKQLAQRKNQEVNFEIDDNIGLMWADERRLKQMIVNLLSNAVKFTPDSGKLGLEVRGDKAGNKVIITAWDNGIGISEKDMQRLFRPFVQLDAGLAREATGTGLGLALVAQMARLHGGSVTVESQVGAGSRFTIRLPWEPALAGDSNVLLRTTGKFRAIRPDEVRPTVLLIEDTHEVVMMLVDYLEMAGFNMVTAQDGIDGLTQAKLFHPSLILMDIQMPRMDGFETTRKLRADPEFRDTPIIALTALAMPNDREHCMEAGMNEYLSKPVNLKALVKTIKTFLHNKETAPS